MDNLDEAWLKAYNGERARMGKYHEHYTCFKNYLYGFKLLLDKL